MDDLDLMLFASTNMGKFREVAEVCLGQGVKVISPEELMEPDKVKRNGWVVSGPPPKVSENADSYLENARLKADAYYAWCGLPSLADDTGLEVDMLQGRPGLHSARFAGPEARFTDNIKKLLAEMESAERISPSSSRAAHFVSVLVLALGNGKYQESRGELQGAIGYAPMGAGGFGYDSVFVVRGYGRTLAELKEEKVPVKTHRILALETLLSTVGGEIE